MSNGQLNQRRRRRELEDSLSSETGNDISYIADGVDSIVFSYPDDEGKRRVLKLYEPMQSEIGKQKTKKIIYKYIRLTSDAIQVVSALEECLCNVNNDSFGIHTTVLPQGSISETSSGQIYTHGQELISSPRL